MAAKLATATHPKKLFPHWNFEAMAQAIYQFNFIQTPEFSNLLKEIKKQNVNI